jgi:hypothetical protein
MPFLVRRQNSLSSGLSVAQQLAVFGQAGLASTINVFPFGMLFPDCPKHWFFNRIMKSSISKKPSAPQAALKPRRYVCHFVHASPFSPTRIVQKLDVYTTIYIIDQKILARRFCGYSFPAVSVAVATGAVFSLIRRASSPIYSDSTSGLARNRLNCPSARVSIRPASANSLR